MSGSLSNRPEPLAHRLLRTAIRAAAVATPIALTFLIVTLGLKALPIAWQWSQEQMQGGLDLIFFGRRWPGHDSMFIWQPAASPPKLNLLPLVFGTLKISLMAVLLGAPLGIGAAFHLNHFARNETRRRGIRTALNLLATMPTVVIGYFCFAHLAPRLQAIFGWQLPFNAATAAFGLCLAVAPITFTVTDRALAAVPKQQLRAARALGAPPAEIVRRVALPLVLPAMVASIVMAMGRAMGETMIVLMASGNAAIIDLKAASSARTLTATLASELAQSEAGSLHERVLFVAIVLLFLLTFTLHRLGMQVVERLQARLP